MTGTGCHTLAVPNQPGLTATLTREPDGWYVALCDQHDVASQGPTPSEALANITEAVGLYLEVQ